jgi:cobaltochelatase CobT
VSKPENPSEPFKRAVAVAVRSLAGEPELEVNFSSEPPSLKGMKARLPSPPRNLKPQEIALVRGVGDAYALRKAYHDEKLNARLKPQSPEANAIFDAAENARVEAIGAIAMEGVKRNLAAQLEQRMVARGLSRAKNKDDVGIADVLGLMVREALTGEKPPASLDGAVDLWRPFIEERAGADIAKLSGALRDQKAFARITKTLLGHLAMGNENDTGPDDSAENDDNESQGEGSESSSPRNRAKLARPRKQTKARKTARKAK